MSCLKSWHTVPGRSRKDFEVSLNAQTRVSPPVRPPSCDRLDHVPVKVGGGRGGGETQPVRVSRHSNGRVIFIFCFDSSNCSSSVCHTTQDAVHVGPNKEWKPVNQCVFTPKGRFLSETIAPMFTHARWRLPNLRAERLPGESGGKRLRVDAGVSG